MIRPRGVFRGADAFAEVLGALTEPVRDLESWLGLVAQATLPWLGDASGTGVQLHAHAADFTSVQWLNGVAGAFRQMVSTDIYRERPSLAKDLFQAFYYPRTSAVMLSSVLGRLPTAWDYFPEYGVTDSCGFVSHPSERVVVTLYCGLPRRHVLSVHEQAQARLVTRFMEAAVDCASVRHLGAVLSPDGEVLDGAGSRVEVWQMLTSGSHRLARRVSAGGVTWVTIENSAWLAPRRRLSRDEGKALELTGWGVSAKEQAWALGVSRSSASRLFRSAITKLGVAAPHDAIRLVSGLLRPALAKAADLTAAEAEVLRLVQQGLSNREIAFERGRSERTVANQVAALLRKAGVPGRRALCTV